jgi:hypothetical protein
LREPETSLRRRATRQTRSRVQSTRTCVREA